MFKPLIVWLWNYAAFLKIRDNLLSGYLLVRVNHVLGFRFHFFQVRMIVFLLENVAVSLLYYRRLEAVSSVSPWGHVLFWLIWPWHGLGGAEGVYSVSHLLHTTKLLCQPWDFLNNQIAFWETSYRRTLDIFYSSSDWKKICRYIEENLFSLNSDYLLEIYLTYFHILFCKTSFILQ